MITRTCAHCSKEYQTYQSIKPKYCSMKCAGEAKKRGSVAKCVQCGGKYWKHKSKPGRMYCSLSCSTTARNLTDTNPAYGRDISGKNNPMYGRGRSGTDNPMHGERKGSSSRWGGGRIVRRDGYILVVVPDNHPNPSETKPSGTKYALEHRIIMESHLGRYLSPGEVVHHIDKDPSNNAIENLRLYANQSEHISDGHG